MGFYELAEILFAQHQAVEEVVLDVVHHPVAGVDILLQIERNKAGSGNAVNKKWLHNVNGYWPFGVVV